MLINNDSRKVKNEKEMLIKKDSRQVKDENKMFNK